MWRGWGLFCLVGWAGKYQTTTSVWPGHVTSVMGRGERTEMGVGRRRMVFYTAVSPTIAAPCLLLQPGITCFGFARVMGKPGEPVKFRAGEGWSTAAHPSRGWAEKRDAGTTQPASIGSRWHCAGKLWWAWISVPCSLSVCWMHSPRSSATGAGAEVGRLEKHRIRGSGTLHMIVPSQAEPRPQHPVQDGPPKQILCFPSREPS